MLIISFLVYEKWPVCGLFIYNSDPRDNACLGLFSTELIKVG